MGRTKRGFELAKKIRRVRAREVRDGGSAYKNGAHGEVVATEVDARTNDSTGETEGGSAVDTHGFLDDCVETEERSMAVSIVHHSFKRTNQESTY